MMNPDQLAKLLSEAAVYGVSEDEARLACPWAFPQPEPPPEPPMIGLTLPEDRQWRFSDLTVGGDRMKPRPIDGRAELMAKLAEYALL